MKLFEAYRIDFKVYWYTLFSAIFYKGQQISSVPVSSLEDKVLSKGVQLLKKLQGKQLFLEQILAGEATFPGANSCRGSNFSWSKFLQGKQLFLEQILAGEATFPGANSSRICSRKSCFPCKCTSHLKTHFLRDANLLQTYVVSILPNHLLKC